MVLRGIQEYFGQPYCRLIDVMCEVPGIVAKFDLKMNEQPDFTTIFTRTEDLEMRIWRVQMRVSAQL